MTAQSIDVRPTPPFAFEHTAENQPYFRKGQSPSNDVYRRLLDLDGKLVLASVQFNGKLDQPELNVNLQGGELTGTELEIARSQVKRLLGTDQEIRPFYEFANDDPIMANLVKAFYGMHHPRPPGGNLWAQP